MGGGGLARGLAREPKGVRSAGRGGWPGLRLSAACGGGIWGGWSCRPSERVTFPPMGCDLRRSPLSPRLGSRPEFRRAPEMAAGTGCLHVALASCPAPSHLEAQERLLLERHLSHLASLLPDLPPWAERRGWGRRRASGLVSLHTHTRVHTAVHSRATLPLSLSQAPARGLAN